MRQFLFNILLLVALSVYGQKKPQAEGRGQKVDYIYLEAQRLQMAGKTDAAFELLNYCKQLDPDNAAVLYSLAPFNLALQNDSAATADMTRAVALAPDNYWYADLLAKIHFNGHRPAEAIKVLEQMNTRWSDKTELLYMLIDAYASQNMADSLLSALERLEVREGKSERITLEKVQVYVQRNDVKSMLDELGALLATDANSELPARLLLSLLREKTDAFALLGDLYHQAGNNEKAFEYYDSCLVYKPDNPMVLNNYAYYLSLQKRDLETAERMSRRSNELEPDNPTYLDTLAWVLYQQGRYAEAKEVMDRTVLLMKPEDLEESADVREHIEQINRKVTP